VSNLESKIEANMRAPHYSIKMSFVIGSKQRRPSFVKGLAGTLLNTTQMF